MGVGVMFIGSPHPHSDPTSVAKNHLHSKTLSPDVGLPEASHVLNHLRTDISCDVRTLEHLVSIAIIIVQRLGQFNIKYIER